MSNVIWRANLHVGSVPCAYTLACVACAILLLSPMTHADGTVPIHHGVLTTDLNAGSTNSITNLYSLSGANTNTAVDFTNRQVRGFSFAGCDAAGLTNLPETDPDFNAWTYTNYHLDFRRYAEKAGEWPAFDHALTGAWFYTTSTNDGSLTNSIATNTLGWTMIDGTNIPGSGVVFTTYGRLLSPRTTNGHVRTVIHYSISGPMSIDSYPTSDGTNWLEGLSPSNAIILIEVQPGPPSFDAENFILISNVAAYGYSHVDLVARTNDFTAIHVHVADDTNSAAPIRYDTFHNAIDAIRVDRWSDSPAVGEVRLDYHPIRFGDRWQTLEIGENLHFRYFNDDVMVLYDGAAKTVTPEIVSFTRNGTNLLLSVRTTADFNPIPQYGQWILASNRFVWNYYPEDAWQTTWPSITNGLVTISAPMMPGTSVYYRCVVTNGNFSAASRIGLNVPLDMQGNTISNAVFVGDGSGLSNVPLDTFGMAGIAYVDDATNTLREYLTNWVTTQAYVTASITNGLASEQRIIDATNGFNPQASGIAGALSAGNDASNQNLYGINTLEANEIYNSTNLTIYAEDQLTIKSGNNMLITNPGIQRIVASSIVFGVDTSFKFETRTGNDTPIQLGNGTTTNHAATVGQLLTVSNQLIRTNAHNTWTARQEYGTNFTINGVSITSVAIPTNQAASNYCVLACEVFGDVTNLFWRPAPSAYGELYALNATQTLLGATYDYLTNRIQTGVTVAVTATPTGLIPLVSGYYRATVAASMDASEAANIEAHLHTNGVEVTPEIGFHEDVDSVTAHHTVGGFGAVYIAAGALVSMRFKEADGDADTTLTFRHFNFSLQYVGP